MKQTTTIVSAMALAVAACSAESSEADPKIAEEASESVPMITDISAADAAEIISSDPSLVVLDVRTPVEFADGHIEGAVNVDFKAEDFTENLAKLDPSKRYVLHCKSGARSSGALEEMQSLGFENIVHMSDGFDAWKAAGNPVAQ